MADAPIVSRPSRYRSQRAPQHTPPTQPQTPPSPNPQNASSAAQDPVARSRSRYKRVTHVPDVPRPVVGDTEGTRQADSRSPPQLTTQARATAANKSSNHAGGPRGAGGVIASTAEEVPPSRATAQSTSPPDTRHASNNRPIHDGNEKETSGLAKDESGPQRAQDVTAPSQSAPSHVKQTSIADLFPPPLPPTPKSITAPNGPPASNRIRATKSLTHLPRSTAADQDDGAGCFAMFKRKRNEAATPSTSEAASPPLPSKNREPQTIRPGGGGVVPGTDAPVSAVNAGDRYVLVECESSKTIFPVKTTTNPVDIIKSASLCMSEHIDVQSAVLYESFGTVGVLRPLRRYEHLRDVMNSWDHDRENSLILFRYNTVDVTGTELSVAGAPTEKPAGDQSWTLLYSQKPGKWEKKLVTLKSDGQLTMQKDAAKPKDLTVLCRLSDFDIYIPTQEKLRKKVKPPKRHCFAVKSQQKTIMFESTQNYVHFFSTGDTATADSFYAAVQGWRSWYLVHVLDEGRKPKITVDAAGDETESRGVAGGVLRDGQINHKTADSVGSHYQLGSFRPLIDLGKFNDNDDRPYTATSVDVHHSRETSAGINKISGQFEPAQAPERHNSQLKRNYPPGSMARGTQLAEDEPLVNLARQNSTNRQHRHHGRRTSLDHARGDSAGEFASSGLLGRSYSQRQREQAAREQQSVNGESGNPFSAGPTLLNLNGSDPQGDEGNVNSNMPRRAPSSRRPDSGKRTTDLNRYSSLNRHHSNSGRTPTGLKPYATNEPQNFDQDIINNNSDTLNRRASQRNNMPKPLIDLTPTYQDPPQHLHKGGAFRPTSSAGEAGAGPLIDNATSPDDPLGLPANTAWKVRRSGSNAGGYSGGTAPGVGGGGLLGLGTEGAAGGPVTNGRYSSHVGIVGGGSNTANASGAGIGTGNANGALLDLSEPDQFAPGTLLNRVEMATKPKELVIDRSKDY